MTPIRITAISFGSFAKLSATLGAAFGLVFGMIAFIVSLLGAPVTTKVIVFDFKGVAAGLVSIIWAPLLLAVFGAVFSLLAYLPIRLFLRYAKGITLRLQTDDAGSYHSH